MLSTVTGYQPGTFTWFGADVHLYENHLDQVREQLSRTPRKLPSLVYSKHAVGVTNINDFEPDDFTLSDYDPYPALKAPMAV